MRKGFKNNFIWISQVVYLTISFYLQNNLDASASACTFGFIFSFMPILLMFLTIFFGILHASPAILDEISNAIEDFAPLFNFKDFANGAISGISISLVNIVLILFIIWMARKLFLSIIQGLSRIFKTEAPSRPIINQLLTFAGEVLLVIICTIVFICAFITRQIFSLPFFQSLSSDFPLIFSAGSNLITNATLYLIIFIFTTFAYKVASGTKPKISHCLLCSALCTACFHICLYVIATFLNRAHYSTIYGMLSNFIILLVEIYLFFVFFMMFAQCLYVIQFFRPLLLSELYLLPSRKKSNILDSARRLLFVTPEALKTNDNSIFLATGQEIYKTGDEADAVFYISNGCIREERNENKIIYEAGSFFGEFEFLLGIKRQGFAIAEWPCTIIKISGSEFSELMEKNPTTAIKAMSKVSMHFKGVEK